MDFPSTGGLRSPFSPRVRQSIAGRRNVGFSAAKKSHGKYMQSGGAQTGDVVYKTPLTTIETYGAPLPVMVTEALTFASGDVSVRLSACGWCWAVAGRRVLAWEWAGDEPAPGPARDLTLPQTDLAHKADLVVLFYDNGAQMPSCIGVSPEGVVRYWASVGQEDVYVDVSAELAGQECEWLGEPSPVGLVLATTTCTVVLLQPSVVDGRATVTCRTLRPPSGWLGGLGRRVSLLFFGSMPQPADTKLVGVVVLEEGPGVEGAGEGVGGSVALLAGGAGGPVLQLWRGAELHEHQLRRPLLDAHMAPQVRGGAGGPVLQLWRGAELHEHQLRRPLLDAHMAPQGECGGGAGGPVLQLWRGAELHEHQLRRPLLDAHMAPQGDPGSLEVVALDVHAAGPSALLVLLAVVNVARAPDTRYAIAHVCLAEAARPAVRALWPLRARGDALHAPRLLPLPAPHAAPAALPPPAVLLYTPTALTVVPMSAAGAGAGPGAADVVEVGAEGDRVLAAQLAAGRVLLFSARHGVLALRSHPHPHQHQHQHAQPDSRADTPSSGDASSPAPDAYDSHLALYEIDPHQVSLVATDACGKLKTAFLFHVRRDSAARDALLRELFPPAEGGAGGAGEGASDVDAPLDRTVLRVAAEMLDDMPAGDPRWKQRGEAGVGAGGVSVGGSGALQVGAQLRDKQRAFALYVHFLQAAGLWARLGLVSDEGGEGCVHARAALGALAERLAVAVALRDLQRGPLGHLVDSAVHQVACGSPAELQESAEVLEALSSGALSPSDVCFRRVSLAPRLLLRLARAGVAAPEGAGAAAAATALADVMQALTTVLSAAQAARAQWAGAGAAGEPPAAPPAPPPRGLLHALRDLHRRALTEVLPRCEGAGGGAGGGAERARLLDAAAALAHAALEDARAHPQFEAMRREAVLPFVEAGQLERAAVLAEKFGDLELLAQLCVRAGDEGRLLAYMDQYRDQGMCEQTFAWLYDRGGGAGRAMLCRWARGRHAARLTAWLQRAPARAPLLALLRAARGQRAAAGAELARLAEREAASVDRMTTIASLAKLHLVSSEEPEPEVEVAEWLRRAESRLQLGEQLAALPRDVRRHHGLEGDCRVVPPEELLQMYIDSDSSSLTEYDYKKALDLTDYIEDMELRDELRLRVWCACIRRDSWAQCDVGAPARELHDKMFFRLVDLVHVMGGDLELLLPAPEDILTAPELAELAADPRFHFIIKYGYECVASGRPGAALA